MCFNLNEYSSQYTHVEKWSVVFIHMQMQACKLERVKTFKPWDLRIMTWITREVTCLLKKMEEWFCKFFHYQQSSILVSFEATMLPLSLMFCTNFWLHFLLFSSHSNSSLHWMVSSSNVKCVGFPFPLLWVCEFCSQKTKQEWKIEREVQKLRERKRAREFLEVL